MLLRSKLTSCLLYADLFSVCSVWQGVEGVLCSGQPAGEPQEQAGDPVDLLDVELELEYLAGFGVLGRLDDGADLPSQLVVESHLLLQGQLLGAQHVQLVADTSE